MVHRYRDKTESQVPCTNVHTGPKQGQEPGPIAFCYVSPVPCTGPSHVAMQRE